MIDRIIPGTRATLPALVGSFLLSLAAGASAGPPDYSPHVARDFPDRLYWGDTHLHTNISSDAYGFGNNLTPETAYAFAKGVTVVSNSGQPARLSRPLDFLLIADHAEYMGVSAMLDGGGDELADSAIGQRWLALLAGGKNRRVEHDGQAVTLGGRQQILLDGRDASMGVLDIAHDPAVARSVWQRVATLADRHNEPGKFTAFIGFEWSALPGGNNLHRNVLFRDGAARVAATLPFSALDSRNPEDLWRYLEQYERDTGGRVLAIPHNPNISNGLMFSDRTFAGEPLDRAYAESRARWEPVMEVTQIKGDSEAHPYLSPEDEFADFETWDEGNFAMPKDPKQKSMLPFEYARPALKNGLRLEQALGVNPFRFAMIGSTDSHVAMSAVEENNYFGKFAVDEPSPRRTFSEPMAAARYVASGYAAVWARENTREAIFDAMQRREVYATTGPRIAVRFFGGWHFRDLDADRPDYAAIGYAGGVPMGGDLGKAPAGASPAFLLVAGKDPLGANLDRVQVIKGWLDADGNTREKVYNAAVSDGRVVDPRTGSVPPLASTVDIATATYTNTVGDPLLSVVWRDPDFDPGQPAFYYARVLEIPTPRWSTYDAAFYGIPLSQKVPPTLQERAYTSPIWYRPP